jgi:hypothetical protein
MRTSGSGCCACAASGHAAAAPPRSAMKLRRLMQNCPSTTSLPKGRVVRHSKIGPPMTHSRSFGDIRAMSELSLQTDLRASSPLVPEVSGQELHGDSDVIDYAVLRDVALARQQAASATAISKYDTTRCRKRRRRRSSNRFMAGKLSPGNFGLLQHGVIPGSCHMKAQGISSPGMHEAILMWPRNDGELRWNIMSDWMCR